MNKHTNLIEAEQVRAQYRNLPMSLAGSVVAAAVTAAPYVGTLPNARLGAWLAIVIWVAIARWFYTLRAYRHLSGTLTGSRPWLVRASLGALAGGCAWGSAGILLFVPDSMPLQAWLAVMLAGMGIAAIPAYATHLPVNFSYFFPSIIPMVLMLLALGTPLALSMSAGFVVFAVAIFNFARNFNRTFLESLRLRHENLDLIAELKAQKEAAEAANLAKSRFLAAASHDLRQPMHALSLYVAALARKPLRADEAMLVNDVRRCAEAMDRLFNALLDISRLDASVVTPSVSAFALNQLMDRIRVGFEPLAQEKGLALRVRPTALVARSDPELLGRIVSNLVSNAIRWTDHGRVLVACRPRGTSVCIVVCDTGPGIPPDKQKLVFEEFYQLRNPERDRSKGLGIGLAVVDRLVKLLGLRLALRSQVGRGTLFEIAVPRADIPDNVPSARHERRSSGISGALVLVVDDEPSVLDATRTLLESWGCDVVTAASGNDVMTRLVSMPRRPDVICCDYRLPGDENGISVINALRSEFNFDIPALLITGDTAPDRLQEAQLSGLALLHKPVTETALRKALVALLSELQLNDRRQSRGLTSN